MTAFSGFLSVASVSSGNVLAVTAGSYEVRVTKITESGGTSVQFELDATRKSGASVSGGTVMPTAPFRGGAPAASATVRWLPSVTGGTTTGSFGSVTAGSLAAGGPAWVPSSDLTIPAGSSLILTMITSSSSTVWFNIEFEELLLAWHY